VRKSLLSGIALVAMVGLSGCGVYNNAIVTKGVAACKAQGGTPT
jgi:hypothetical protein